MSTLSEMTTERQREFLKGQQRLHSRMKKIQHKIAVISGKGGVGKSTMTVNLAAAFAVGGHVDRIGVLDADIHGPTVPKLLGLSGQRFQMGPSGVLPIIGQFGIRVVSIDFLLPGEESPVIWRGPLKMAASRQFVTDIDWGELDVLFIDLPPGTGDEPLSIAQLLPTMDGVVIVTMPSEISQTVVKKAVTFARTVGMPIVGVVENMSRFICPHCKEETDIFQDGGGLKLAKELNIPFLGSIPIDPEINTDSDRGRPLVLEHRESAAAKAFSEITEKVAAYLERMESRK